MGAKLTFVEKRARESNPPVSPKSIEKLPTEYATHECPERQNPWLHGVQAPKSPSPVGERPSAPSLPPGPCPTPLMDKYRQDLERFVLRTQKAYLRFERKLGYRASAAKLAFFVLFRFYRKVEGSLLRTPQPVHISFPIATRRRHAKTTNTVAIKPTTMGEHGVHHGDSSRSRSDHFLGALAER